MYILCVLLPVVFGMNPVTAGMGMLSGLMLLGLTQNGFPGKELAWALGIVAFSGILNPVFNHNGQTVLFFLNRNPVTLEALLYGLVMGMMIASALLWGRCFSRMMDTDRMMCVLGRLSPKVSLILSMTLRYIPLMRTQAGRVREAQTGLGLIREENGLDRVKGAVRVFDGMVTWGLENGITMADSMTARGYGTGRRTRYELYPWEKADTALTAASLSILAMTLGAHAAGWIGYTWYPALTTPELSPRTVGAYAVFGLLCMGSSVLEALDRIHWKRLRDRAF